MDKFLGITAVLLAFLLVAPAIVPAQTASPSKTGVVVGGAVGGIAGSTLGKGTKYQSLLTLLGTGVGSYIGSMIPGLVSGGSSGGGGGGSLTFGGMIGSVIPCTCSPGAGIIVGPPKGGIFLLAPGSRIYANARPVPGSWVLGDYAPGGICLQIASKGCYPYPPIQGTIIKIGTS